MLRIRRNDATAVGRPRIWADIDLGAVRQNTAQFLRLVPRGCRLIAVVKADGYGHGALRVAQAALQAGAAELAVADAGEGVALRQGGIDAPILILGPSAPADVPVIVEHGLVPAVADLELAAALDAGASGRLDIEVEVDTGMCRHGIEAAAAADFVRALRVYPMLRVRSIYTHFAGLGAAGLPDMQRQWRRFCAVRSALTTAGHQPRAHACNTAATVLLPDAHADAVRIGGGLYGFDGGSGAGWLRPAMTLKTRIAAIRRAARGDRVGYGGLHVCRAATTLALLPCGYADGLARAHWNDAEVLVRGRRARIVGNVSMNQAVVDLHDVEAEVGDEVVLLGEQGGEVVRPEHRAAAGSSAYEVTALLRAAMERPVRG